MSSLRSMNIHWRKINSLNKSDNVKVINLVKSIEKVAERESEDLFLLSLAQRAQAGSR